MVTRIKVTNLDGTPIGWKAAIVRSSVDLVYSIISSVGRCLAISSLSASVYYDLGHEGFETLNEMSPIPEWVRWLWIAWFTSEVIVLLFNEKRRALHDYLAKTIVVHL